MPRLRISIVTPSFNQAPFIERTICSILNQGGDFDLEYLVVDGGSTDGTIAILQRYSEFLTWTSEHDQGQVDAINKGLRRTTGDIVAWVNSDDLLLPGALERVANAFAANSNVEWLHGRCEIIDINDRPIRRLISYYKHTRAIGHTFENLLTENYISQMTVFWRRSVLSEVGYLDPSLSLAFDYDYWLRLARRSVPIYLRDRLACFRWYETTKSGASFEAQFREDYAVAARNAEGRSAILLKKRLANIRTVAIYKAMRLVRLAVGAVR